ncbi:MAG TPA: hypothetical protein VKP04_07565 [Ktedonobacteraceae bacterium]|nr:hypothetical protein [Ktedonobacteraceae bacterium]
MYLDENKIVLSMGPTRFGELYFADVVKEYGPFRLRQMVHRSPEGRVSIAMRLGIFLKPEQQDVPLDLLEGTAQEIPLGGISIDGSDFLRFLAVMRQWVYKQDFMINTGRTHWEQYEDQEFAEQALADIEWRWVRRQNFVKPAVEKLERESRALDVLS